MFTRASSKLKKLIVITLICEDISTRLDLLPIYVTGSVANVTTLEVVPPLVFLMNMTRVAKGSFLVTNLGIFTTHPPLCFYERDSFPMVVEKSMCKVIGWRL